MTLLPDDNFIDRQRERVEAEIEHWLTFAQENSDGAYYPFTTHRREGQHFVQDNRVPPEKESALREYVKLPDVAEIAGVLVDLQALQIPYNCMWKSCRLTGHYCCKVTTCTAHTDTSAEIMREAGREHLDRYQDEERKARIRRGDTHTEKMQYNAQHDGHCVFGEERVDTDPDTGEEHPHIHCGLHEAAYDNDFPMHYAHSIGSSLFPADILILDGQFFVTAASKRAKEHEVTRWWVTSDRTICTAHGDTRKFGILQHPDFDAMYADILGRSTLDAIQEEAYGQAGAVEPEIQDGWIHADERGLEPYTETCRKCDGDGCDSCDERGYYRHWRRSG